MDLNCRYADDGILIRRIEEVQKALEILQNFGPDFSIALKVSKTKAHWASTDLPALQTLRASVPIDIAQETGLVTLGAPVGSTQFTQTTLVDKLKECKRSHAPLTEIPDARIRFHLHRMTVSTCKVLHIFRFVSTTDSARAAATFGADQRSAFCPLNRVKLSDPASKRIPLPLKMGGYGFVTLAPHIHDLYAASLVDSAKLRIPDPLSPHTVVLSRVWRYTAQGFRRQTAHLQPAPKPTLPSQQEWLLGTFRTGDACCTNSQLYT